MAPTSRMMLYGSTNVLLHRMPPITSTSFSRQYGVRSVLTTTMMTRRALGTSLSQQQLQGKKTVSTIQYAGSSMMMTTLMQQQPRPHKNFGSCLLARHASSYPVDPHDDDDEDDSNVNTKNVVPFLLADIGEGIQEVEVLQWFVQKGDHVQEFDTICQVQSDKATVEITSRFAGKIVDISPDTHISVGQPLVHIETASPPPGASASGSGSDSSSSTPSPPPPTELEQQQHKDHETQDSESRLNIPSAPTHFALDSDVSDIETDGMDASSESSSSSATKYLASPAVRKLAADHGINVRAIQGTGPQGRVLKADILQYVQQTPSSATQDGASATSGSSPQPTPKTPLAYKDPADTEETTTVVSMKGYNKFMVQSMTDSLQIPHMSLGDEIVVDKLIEFRSDWNASQTSKADSNDAEPQHKLGLQTLLIKACSMALKEHPAVNAKTHNVDECQVCYHNSHDIGIAMDTPHGLVVPVVRQVNKKSLVEIQQEVNRLKHAASLGTTDLADLVPSPTFTLSNIGAVGVGTNMSPVLVPPLIAMGALGRIQKLPRFDENDDVVPTHILYVSWVADHRFLDGASLARFHKSFAKYASNPLLMLPFLK